MKTQLIPLVATNQFSNFVVDFVEEKKTFSFLPNNYFDENYLLELIEQRKKFTTNRTILVEVLLQQNEHLVVAEKSKLNIQLLNSETTFTITTAHQPCFVGGPLYTVYKAISAITTAEHYKNKFPQFDFVPVYYIGSEDHDLAELNHFNLFGKKTEWLTNQSGAVGSMHLEGVEILIEELKNKIANEPFATEVIAIIEKAYQPNHTMATAFRILMHELLGKYGLVILDANDARLKKQFANVMWDEVQNETAIGLLENENWTKNFGGTLQIKPRPINFFLLQNQIRNRIENENETWKVNNSNLSFSKNEIEKLIAENPEKLSPNVVLRPLYQSTILPDVCFIGGGSEVTYWLQLETLFKHYQIPFPKILLRHSLIWLDEKNKQKMLKWNFSNAEIFDDLNFLIKKFTEQSGGLIIDAEIDTLKKQLENLQTKITAHDKGLEGTMAASFTQIQNQLEQLPKKILQSDKKKQADAIAQITKWKEKILPQNQLPERFENWMEYYLRYGKNWIEIIYTQFKNEPKKLMIVEE